MAWIRLDDQIAHHPKILKCSSSACWVYVTCISYAQRMLTDGHLTRASVPLLSHVRRPQKCIAELVAAGLLEKTRDGYKIHDYLDFNESAESVKLRRERDRRRKASERNPQGVHAESNRSPQGPSRARASHPIPSSKEQKISAVAARRHNGKSVENPYDNGRVILRLIHTILDDPSHPEDAASLVESIKSACALKHISYNSEVIWAQLASAQAQRVTP